MFKYSYSLFLYYWFLRFQPVRGSRGGSYLLDAVDGHIYRMKKDNRRRDKRSGYECVYSRYLGKRCKGIICSVSPGTTHHHERLEAAQLPSLDEAGELVS